MTDGTALDKTFDPAAIEAKWYAHWEENGLFRPQRPEAVPYTIVNPPPNVTGSLHIGHALDNTLQDIMIRYERLRGKDALWVVGTDHAGIATQMVVERQLEAAQDKRTNYTREDFVAKVWEWKHDSGGTITQQLRRLGCSMDWSREQFTMDPHFTTAVVKVFVHLYNKGLIYRDKRLVNWDPKLKTAISDLEVETRELKGHFWHFRYPLADGVRLANGADHIVVATTRPETMLADMCVAVNADDPRYQSVIGQFIEQPITGRRLQIVADEHADPALGSGAVKITPGHDFNDFEVGKRAGIKPADMLNMFDAEAKVVQTSDLKIPDKYLGLDRFVVREMIVADLKAASCLVPHLTKDKAGEEVVADAEPRTMQTPFGDRGGVVIEPWLTDQWYVNAAELAKAPLDAVRSGAVEIVPKSWEKTFFNWMENIQPWCVSRQLWWGHRIPAWYGQRKDGDDLYGHFSPFIKTGSKRACFVAETDEQALALAKQYYGEGFAPYLADENDSNEFTTLRMVEEGQEKPVELIRDPDVLDTWFSSALWPFATLGWPDESPSPVGKGGDGGSTLASNPHPNPSPSGRGLVERHYPNDLLISGFDILFFWDARMMMLGQALTGQNPWPRLYLHGLVRAPDGQKMSKSKGNVIDPLLLIDQFGADALRFFMAAMESQGRDIKMDERRVEGYRNFATKLWNAARFCQDKGIRASLSLEAPKATSALNKWIVGETIETLATMEQALTDLRFDAAANAIYHFVWDTFCDWYIELIKPVLGAVIDPIGEAETRQIAGWVLDQILVMLHPFMPFVTEELWGALGDRGDYPLITAKWPEPGVGVDVEAKAEVDWLIALISEIRTARTAMGIPPGKKMAGRIEDASPEAHGWSAANASAINRLARVFVVPENRLTGDWPIQPLEEISTESVGFIEATTLDGPTMRVPVAGATIVLSLDGVIDIAAEKARLTKALETSTKEAKALEGRLSNPSFVEKAKPEAVEKARADHALHAAEAERLAAALARLG